jgi:hypothetical protein
MESRNAHLHKIDAGEVKQSVCHLVPRTFVADGKLVSVVVHGTTMFWCEQSLKSGEVLSATQVIHPTR